MNLSTEEEEKELLRKLVIGEDAIEDGYSPLAFTTLGRHTADKTHPDAILAKRLETQALCETMGQMRGA